MAASNTVECFHETIGLRVRGVLEDIQPNVGRRTTTLVFEDFTGLTIADNGAHWRETADDVQKAIQRRRAEIDSLIVMAQQLLRLATGEA